MTLLPNYNSAHVSIGGSKMRMVELEMEYGKSLQRHFDNLKKLFELACSRRAVNFKDDEISQAILLRLRSYYKYQNLIKQLLNKRYAAPASDFFVETVLFYLKVCLRIYKTDLQVQSEKQIRGRGSPRPDISVWKNDDLIAVIECKTQLGWNRHKWRENFEKRGARIKRLFPKAKCYLFVMTSKNWPGFGQNLDVGKKLFCLCNVWPDEIEDKRIKDHLLNPIDPVIQSFVHPC